MKRSSRDCLRRLAGVPTTERSASLGTRSFCLEADRTWPRRRWGADLLGCP